LHFKLRSMERRSRGGLDATGAVDLRAVFR